MASLRLTRKHVAPQPLLPIAFQSPWPPAGPVRHRGNTCTQRRPRMCASRDMLRAAAAGDVASLSRTGRALAAPIASIADDRGATAIHIASAAGHDDAVAVLFEIARGAGGATAQFGHDQAAAVAYVCTRDKHGSTPLHYAARGGAYAAARRLLLLGAQLDATDDVGRTPRDVAANDAMRELLSSVL